jgi:hypothetical protein
LYVGIEAEYEVTDEYDGLAAWYESGKCYSYYP